jgi:hypothetical protein
MSELVQIAPGVVFSSDVLGADWVRKHQSGAEGTQSTTQQSSAAKESNQAGRPGIPGQLSLL